MGFLRHLLTGFRPQCVPLPTAAFIFHLCRSFQLTPVTAFKLDFSGLWLRRGQNTVEPIK